MTERESLFSARSRAFGLFIPWYMVCNFVLTGTMAGLLWVIGGWAFLLLPSYLLGGFSFCLYEMQHDDEDVQRGN